MKKTCRKCKNPYYFDDSKIPDEGLQFRCPRCGNIIVFSKEAPGAPVNESARRGGDSETNPIVYGAYSGALGGFGCAIPLLMLTLLGIGVMSLGMQVSGYNAAAALLLILLKALSLGVLIGISLSFIGAKTGTDVWSVKGGLIGALIGVVIGIISGVFFGSIIGGIFGVAVIFGSVIGWFFKAVLASIVVILVRRRIFPADEGDLSSSLSGRQMALVGVLFFLMVFTIGMDIKGAYGIKPSLEQAKTQMSSEGLVVKDDQKSTNSSGDLVISGTIVNTSANDKTGWIVVAELLDDGGNVVRKATLLNGDQMFSVKDIEAMRKRGQNIQRPKPSEARDKMIIKHGDSFPFEVLFIDPPAEFKGYNLKLKTMDEEGMKEIFVETINNLKDLKDMKGKKE